MTASGPASSARHLVLALHGINTDRDDVTWPERFEAYQAQHDAGLNVVTDHYRAWPFPRINCLIKNRRIGKAQAHVLAHWVKTGRRGTAISLVGHSNGCDIIRHTAAELIRLGIPIDKLILLAAPIDPALPKLAQAVEAGQIRSISAWCSPNDHVLGEPGNFWANAIRWPYGNLGRAGTTDGGKILEFDPPHQAQPIYTRWFDWGHSDAFDQAHEAQTYETIITEILA